MEATALKGSGGDVQHFADRIGRAWRPPWPRGNDPNAHLTSETPVVACPFRVRFGRGGISALSPFYPQLRTLLRAVGTAEKCHKRLRAAAANTKLLDHLVGAGE